MSVCTLGERHFWVIYICGGVKTPNLGLYYLISKRPLLHMRQMVSQKRFTLSPPAGIRGIPKPYPGDDRPLAPVEGPGSAIVPPPQADPRGSLALAGALAQGRGGSRGLEKGVPLTLRLISRATSGALTKLVGCREMRGRRCRSQAIGAPGRRAAPTIHPTQPHSSLFRYQQLPPSRRLKSQSKLGKIWSQSFYDVFTCGPAVPTVSYLGHRRFSSVFGEACCGCQRSGDQLCQSTPMAITH